MDLKSWENPSKPKFRMTRTIFGVPLLVAEKKEATTESPVLSE